MNSPRRQGTVEQVNHASGWGTLRDELGALWHFETDGVDEALAPGSRVRFKPVDAGKAMALESLGPSLADVVATLHAHSIATSFEPSASHEACTLGELLQAHYASDEARGMREGFLAVDRRFAAEHADVVALLGGWGGVQITTRDVARPPQDLLDAVAQVNAALRQRGAAFLIASLLSYGDVIALLRIPAAQMDAFLNAGVVNDVPISLLRAPVVLWGLCGKAPPAPGALLAELKLLEPGADMGADDSWQDADLEGGRAEVIDAADVPPDLAAQAGRPIERAVRFTSPGGTTRSVVLVELLIGPRLASASDGVFIDRTGRRLDAMGP